MPAAKRTVDPSMKLRVNSLQLTVNKKFRQMTAVRCQLSYGYTLVEFLIVIGILSASMGSLLLFMTSVIKGANQTNIVSEVKQNGQAVLGSLETQIRSATDVEPMVGTEFLPAGASNGNSGIVLTKQAGGYIYLICVNSSASPAANGWIGIYSDNLNSPPTGASKYQKLTNNESTLSGIDINCDVDPTATTASAFQVSPVGSALKVVTINFIANQGVAAPSRADFLANAQFRTTISLRKYN